MRTALVVGLVIVCAGCGGNDSLTAPTAQTPAVGITAKVPESAVDLRGNYEITFAADAACTDLPAAVRTRTYSASLTATASGPSGASSYLATLGNADFGHGSSKSYPDWNVVYVTASADVGHIYFSDPPIWEHLTHATDLTPGTDLVIVGDATGAFRADTSGWSFAGTFTYCPSMEADDYPECAVRAISCLSHDHQLTLTRR